MQRSFRRPLPQKSSILTYLLHGAWWEANWFAASQEILRISRNPKVHYRTHKRPPPACILDQPNPVHIPTSHLLEIHPNIIHPSTPTSPQWSLSLRFPHQDLIHLPLLTHTRQMPDINWYMIRRRDIDFATVSCSLDVVTTPTDRQSPDLFKVCVKTSYNFSLWWHFLASLLAPSVDAWFLFMGLHVEQCVSDTSGRIIQSQTQNI